MTSPDRATPDKAVQAGTVQSYQNANKETLAGASNGDLLSVLQLLGDNLFHGLLGGFTNVGNAIFSGIQGIVTSITGVVNGGLNTLETYFKQLLDAASGIPILGPIAAKLSDLFFHQAAVANTASSAASTAAQASTTAIVATNQVTYVTQVINVRSGRSLADSGPDPTGDPTFSFSDCQAGVQGATLGAFTCSNSAHTHTAGSIAVSASTDYDKVVITSTNAPWGMLRLGGASKKKVVTWIGMKTGSVTGFFLDLYKMRADGTFDFVATSQDQSGLLGGSMFVNQTTFDAETLVDLGDVYAVQFRIVGTGSVTLPAKRMFTYGFLASFVPSSLSAARDPSGTAAPASLSPSTMAGLYNYLIPWFSWGIDLGAAPTPRYFTDNYNRATIGNGYTLFMPGRAAANAPQIESYAFSYNRSTGTDGYGGGAYPQPLISDKWFCEFRLAGQNDRPHGMYIGASTGQGALILMDSSLGFRVFNSVATDDWANPNIVERTALRDTTIKGAGLWRVEFDASTRVVNVFLNNSPTPVKSFTDLSNYIPTGPGNRFFGPAVSRFSFGVSYNVDDLTFGDIAT